MKSPRKDLKFQDVWRVCNKIRAAVFRIGLNLWDYFRPLDPNNNGLISETKFIAVFTGPLRHCVGLSDAEITDLADYFSIQDGRIIYRQLCQIIHDSVPEFTGKPMITGLEWEEPLAVNRLSCSEHRKLNLIITQISLNVRKRMLVLRPYFQDYELISKNTGSVTTAHFGRILHFLGIVLASEEFNLLVKRFAIDGYTLNYIAFLKAIDDAQNYMDDHGMLHVSGVIFTPQPTIKYNQSINMEFRNCWINFLGGLLQQNCRSSLGQKWEECRQVKHLESNRYFIRD
uniref:Rnz protein n=1 Tax=Fopius arisanus TaxID=64838 RepID=A0A0C9QPI7_9HYME